MGLSMSTTTPERPGRAGPRVSLSLDRSGGANPADAAGTNINSLVANFKKTGTMPNVQLQNPLYGDFTFPTDDIHQIREAVHQAEARFMQLPADVRTLAQNDWVEFLTLYNNPESRELLIKAGLIVTNKPPIEEPPTTSPAAPETTEGTPFTATPDS